MRGTFKIAKLFGIPVMLHWSFLLLVPFGVYYSQALELTGQEVQWWSLLSVSVVTCILFHEIGHALIAKRYGVETQDIILFPIGGMARLNRLPDKPVQELLVALAGPMMNVLIAALLFPFFWFLTRPYLVLHDIPSPENIDDNFFLFLPLLLFLNLLLAVFNLIPAFPMDGGRILRALLSIKWGRVKATKVAVVIGLVVAVGLTGLGVWLGRYSYLFIGFFIAYTAIREYSWVKTEHLLASYKVADVFLRDHLVLSLSDVLQKAVDAFEISGQQGFIVFGESGDPVGTIDLAEMTEL